MNKPKSSKVKVIMIASTVLLLAGGGVYLWWSSAGWTNSIGARTGIVIKFSEKGGFGKWDTHEGELQQGANVKKWEFSVYEKQDGEGIIKQVENAMDSGKRVKIHYRQQREMQSWKGKTTYFVTKVEYLDNR